MYVVRPLGMTALFATQRDEHATFSPSHYGMFALEPLVIVKAGHKYGSAESSI